MRKRQNQNRVHAFSMQTTLNGNRLISAYQTDCIWLDNTSLAYNSFMRLALESSCIVIMRLSKKKGCFINQQACFQIR